MNKKQRKNIEQHSNKAQHKPSPDISSATAPSTTFSDNEEGLENTTSPTPATTTRLSSEKSDDPNAPSWAVGIFDDALFEEEHDFLPALADKEHYITMRQKVVEEWRKNVSRVLTLDDALKQATREKDIPYIYAAWTFLEGRV